MSADTQLTRNTPFLSDVIDGLSQPQKSLPCKYFYDDKGSALFEQITQLPEYYPSRTEHALLRQTAPDIAANLGANPCIIEYGAGALIKIRTLLDAISGPAVYVPIDVSGPFLFEAADTLKRDYPACDIRPVEGRFLDTDLDLPLPETTGQKMAFFPGSTLGNFDDDEIITFMRLVREHVGPRGQFLLGVDINEDADSLIAAYNDSEGLTAAFNLNLLARINRELGATIDISAFRHEAIWNPDLSRIEMYLIATRNQQIQINGHSFPIRTGERIHTENSGKFTEERLNHYASKAGWTLDTLWTSNCKRMALVLLI
ncbi:MAG: L-histidine N(alpha)-methyltransferase [Pseudomonadota bacterium]